MKKVLAVTDIHFRDSDFTTIKHSTKATEKVFYDIIKFAEKTDDLTIILGGDVFDKGYRQVGPSYAHRNLIERLHLACDGELYLVMGNHVFLERDSNPELYLMQLHSTFKPLIETYAIRPLLKYKVMNSAFESMLSFSEYMRRNGFSDKAIHFFQTAVESDIDVATAVTILGIE